MMPCITLVNTKEIQVLQKRQDCDHKRDLEASSTITQYDSTVYIEIAMDGPVL